MFLSQFLRSPRPDQSGVFRTFQVRAISPGPEKRRHRDTKSRRVNDLRKARYALNCLHGTCFLLLLPLRSARKRDARGRGRSSEYRLTMGSQHFIHTIEPYLGRDSLYCFVSILREVLNVTMAFPTWHSEIATLSHSSGYSQILVSQ